MPSGPVYLTKPQVAAMLGVDVRSVTTYQADKRDPLPVANEPKRGIPNKYDPRAVFNWALRRRLGEINDDDDQQLDLDFERARKTRAEADLQELKLAETRARLLDADLVRKAFVVLLARFRARMLAIPPKAGPLCATADAKKSRVILKDHIYEALTELSSDEFARAIKADIEDDLESNEDSKAAA
ncbi:terminase small subunit [Marinihelvus fidelis]|uniref:Terminase small subunit n=1 Tax=Marinihelvus fidelis TaxID=2613842 RepID=A0A5N0THY2_9GAMM|nr:terminase small subunit [Marinihelvus fidelis]KAA9133466.1 terminase small subunit [Marinihelvus fidelis]